MGLARVYVVVPVWCGSRGIFLAQVVKLVLFVSIEGFNMFLIPTTDILGSLQDLGKVTYILTHRFST